MNDTTPLPTKPKRKDQLLTQRAIWKKGFKILGETRSQTFWIALVGLILPQLAIQVFFDQEAFHTAQVLKNLTETMQMQATSFADLMATAAVYFSSYLFVNLLYILIILTSYLALTHISIQALRGQQAVKLGPSLLYGLKLSVPRGILVVMIFAVLFTLGQVLVFPLIIVASLGLMIPVILVTENASALRSVRDAIFMRYAKHTAYSGWTIMFALLTVAAIFYTAILGFSFVTEWLLHLDETLQLPRTLWTMTFSGSQMPIAYFVTQVLSTGISGAIVAIIPAITAAAYFEIVTPRTISQA